MHSTGIEIILEPHCLKNKSIKEFIKVYNQNSFCK